MSDGDLSNHILLSYLVRVKGHFLCRRGRAEIKGTIGSLIPFGSCLPKEGLMKPTPIVVETVEQCDRPMDRLVLA